MEFTFIWFLSQFFAISALALNVWSLQIKNRARMFFINSISMLCILVSALLLQNWIYAAIIAFVPIRNGGMAWFEYRKQSGKAVPKSWFWILFALALFFSAVFPLFFIEGWLGWAMFVSNQIILVGVFFLPAAFRAGILISEGFTVVNHSLYFNIFGILFSIFKMTNILIFYFRVWRKKRQEAQAEEETAQEHN